MKVWFDITNTPHVMTFKPFINLFMRENAKIIITCRNIAQTEELLKKEKLEYVHIGSHKDGLFFKFLATGVRTISLLNFLRREKPDLCFTKNPSSLLSAKLCRIPSVFFSDNEKSMLNDKIMKLATLIVTPECMGLSAHNAIHYKGVEEGLYLYNFFPQKYTKPDLLDPSKKNVLVRTTPLSANYLRNVKSDPVLKFIEEVGTDPQFNILLIPRKKSEFLLKSEGISVRIPPLPIDGPVWEYYCDAVVSGGGTMTREAALLGTLAISMYPGKELLAVDKYLIRKGILFHELDEEKVKERIERVRKNTHKKVHRELMENPKNLLEKILSEVW